MRPFDKGHSCDSIAICIYLSLLLHNRDLSILNVLCLISRIRMWCFDLEYAKIML